MLESAEIGHRVSKAAYAREEPKLREALLDAQFAMGRDKRGPLLVMINGVEGGGRGETANTLNAWLDPRHIRTHAFGARGCEEVARPPEWRYWRALPPRGTIGIFMYAWYRELMDARIREDMSDDRFATMLHEVRQYEQMLAAEGVVLVKFWLHLSRDDQKKRLKELKAKAKTRWPGTNYDLKALHRYGENHATWEHMLRETSIAQAPWYVIEGVDERYRMLTVGKVLLGALQSTVDAKPVASPSKALAPAVIGNVALIRSLDLGQKLGDEKYEHALDKWQHKLAAITRHRRFKNRALVLAFEGSDAAGKGGAIRRVSGALDARQYVIMPIAAPTEEERAQPYLWRFWRHIPAKGSVTIFDRSWYGRVLVERVEGYCATVDWMRAYDEINQFEEQLVKSGIVLCKFWLQISKAEQLRRFKARENTAFKQFKITADDWRNRKKWGAYEQAVADMVYRTSTEIAPWTLVEAEDKNFARIKVLSTIVRALGRDD